MGLGFGPSRFQKIYNYTCTFKVFVSDESKNMSVFSGIVCSRFDSLDFEVISICFNSVTMETLLFFINNNLLQVLEWLKSKYGAGKKPFWMQRSTVWNVCTRWTTKETISWSTKSHPSMSPPLLLLTSSSATSPRLQMSCPLRWPQTQIHV